ncbi:MAG: hypothetical protein IPL79_09310 [Myxococcales bacterium]|nr:hypothetical protein [Myxococcales bacterium]
MTTHPLTARARRASLPIAGALFGAFTSAATASSAIVDQANAWEMNVTPATNAYASPSKVSVDAGGLVTAAAVCGGYAALVVRATYPTLTTTVMRALTGSSAPTSKQWNDAIENGATYQNTAGTFSLVEQYSIYDIAGGDILASEYLSSTGTTTGHTMIVDSLWLDTATVATNIPGVPVADRWIVAIHDATSSPHGASDSRWKADANFSHDAGIGAGEIIIYADHLSGAIMGWAWSTTTSVVYQGTDETALRYRPMVAGRLAGPGID